MSTADAVAINDEINRLMSLARAHTEAAIEGKPQEIMPELADHMGAFLEQALSPTDAAESIFDLEVSHHG